MVKRAKTTRTNKVVESDEQSPDNSRSGGQANKLEKRSILVSKRHSKAGQLRRSVKSILKKLYPPVDRVSAVPEVSDNEIEDETEVEKEEAEDLDVSRRVTSKKLPPHRNASSSSSTSSSTSSSSVESASDYDSQLETGALKPHRRRTKDANVKSEVKRRKRRGPDAGFRSRSSPRRYRHHSRSPRDHQHRHRESGRISANPRRRRRSTIRNRDRVRSRSSIRNRCSSRSRDHHRRNHCREIRRERSDVDIAYYAPPPLQPLPLPRYQPPPPPPPQQLYYHYIQPKSAYEHEDLTGKT